MNADAMINVQLFIPAKSAMVEHGTIYTHIFYGLPGLMGVFLGHAIL